MSDRQTMDLAERREADRRIKQVRVQAREDYLRHAKEAAEADTEYRKTKARVYVELRAQGETSEGAKIQAEAESVDAKARSAIAAADAKAALMRVDEAERDNVTVRDLHSTSERIDGVAP